MANQEVVPVVLDGLPYVETVDEDYEAYALSLIEEEMAKISPRSMQELPPLKLSEMGQQQYDAVASGEEITRFQPQEVSTPSDMDDVEAWEHSVQHARAAYEAERLRKMILDLESDHGAHQWKHYTSNVLENLSSALQQNYSSQREVVDEINVQRQKQQQPTGQTLQVLRNQWHELIQKKHALAMATLQLEVDVDALK